MGKLAMVAVGGNSLIKDSQHQTVPDQYAAAVETSVHIAGMIEQGWDVVLTHGNGPQVGFILRRSELSLHELHPVPLDYCGADTQGAIGYMFQRALRNEFKKRGIKKQAATVVSQVLVDMKDPAFQNPSKPIGSFMDKDTARGHKDKEGWSVVEDAGRGWRRVVPSPLPKALVERDAVEALIKAGFIVICSGGGGIPVIEEKGNPGLTRPIPEFGHVAGCSFPFSITFTTLPWQPAQPEVTISGPSTTLPRKLSSEPVNWPSRDVPGERGRL